jgi:uncharacterized protein
MPLAIDALYPSRIHTTREDLRARFQAGAAVRRYTSVREVTIHETSDPEVIVAEYELHGEMTATGEPFSARFAMVITVRDGTSCTPATAPPRSSAPGSWAGYPN